MILTSYSDKSYLVSSPCGYVAKHSKDFGRQVETPCKSTIFVARQLYLVVRNNFYVALETTFTITGKQMDGAIDTFLV